MAGPTPPVPGVIKLDHVMTVGADTNAHCHIFWGYTGAATLAQLNALANALFNPITTNLRTMFSPSVTFSRVDVIDMANPAAPVGSATIGSAGNRAGGTLTGETAALINLKVARRYKGGHPRIYWPAGVATDLSTPQAWSGAFSGTFQTAWTTYLASITGATGGPSLTTQKNVSFYTAHAPRATPLVEDIVAWSVNPKPASQRRRMVR